MENKSLISLIFLQAITNGVNLVIAQKPGPRNQFFKCSNNGNFKSDIQVEYRDSAFSVLHKRLGSMDYTGYQIGYKMGDVYEVWIAILCPPNIKKEACWECINNTIPYLKKNCPKQKLGVAWTVLANLNCMVRYEDYKSQLTLLEWANWTSFSSPSNQAPSNASDLEKGVNNLANNLKGTAANGGIVTKFGSGHVPYGSGSHTLYGAMQCTPDIDEKDCMKCLSDATNALHKCCSKERKLYGITMSANCYFWYSHQKSLSKTPLTISPETSEE